MKNINYNIIATLLCLGAVSCQIREQVDLSDSVDPNKITVRFVSNQLPTKTAFSDAVDDGNGNLTYPTLWTGNEPSVGVSLNLEEQINVAVIPDDNKKGASFETEYEYSVENDYDDFTFFVVSPSTALSRPSPSRGAMSITIPTDQTPVATSVDESAQILFAKSATTSTISQEINVHFKHLTAYGKLALSNLAIPSDATVTSVCLTAGKQWAGDYYYDITDGTLDGKDGSYTIQVNNPDIDAVWFACAPVDLKGSSIRILVNFSDGTAKQRTVDLDGISLYFEAGCVTSFSANMASAEELDYSLTTEEVVFELVTSLNSLANGDEVIIVNNYSSPSYAMSSTANGSSGISPVAEGTSNPSGYIYTSSDGYIRLASSSNVAVWTIEGKTTSSGGMGGNSGTTMKFKNGSNYLYHYSSSGGVGGGGGNSSRYLTIGSTSTAWTVSFSSSRAQIKSGNYYVTYSNNYFKESSSSSDCAIYKKTTITSSEDGNPAEAAIINYDTYGAYIQGNPLIYSATSDQLSREYLSDGTVTFAIVDAADESYVEFSGIPTNAAYLDTFNLKLVYKVQLITCLEFTYTVTVVKEDGAKLWLTDGTNGFIVKR